MAAQYARDRVQRLTHQFVRFEEICAGLVRILDARHTRAATKLADEGRRLLAEFASARHLAHGHPDRTAVVTQLLDYQQQALVFIGGGR